MEEQVILIREDVLSDVRKMVLLINHHENILASMKVELAQMLRFAHGVNLSAPGTVLDAEGGVIVQRSETATPAPFVVEAPEEQR